MEEVDTTPIWDKTWYRILLQVTNVGAFGVAMLLNGLSPVIMPNSLSEITDGVDSLIAPDGFAFSIWGLIYSLIGIFVIYQALPQVWTPNRNNELIFGWIGWVFPINMIINGLWLIIFQTYSGVGMVLGLIDIVMMLATNTYIMMVSTRFDTNWTEWIGLRGGFSIYSGWVTAATILNATFMLKFFGVEDPIFGWEWIDEE